MIEQWADVTAKSTKGVASDMGFHSCEVKGSHSNLPKGLAGAFIPLVGNVVSLQLGILSDQSGQEGLARAVLQMEDDEAIEHEEITDAVGELANCLAGRVKREMRKVDGTLRIGLPVFIEGHVEDTGKSEFKVINAVMNGINVSILVVVSK